MKVVFVVTLIAIASSVSIPALAADHQHGDHAAMQAKGTVQMIDGVVKKVDLSSGKITLSHGPLQNLGMPAMTMAFPVTDSAWLANLKEGDKVRFRSEMMNGVITVVHLEAAM